MDIKKSDLMGLVKKLAPGLVFLLVFTCIGYVYFSPVLEGKVLKQVDVAMARGGIQDIVEYKTTYGERHVWSNSSFSGMPTFISGSDYVGQNVFVQGIRVLSIFVQHPISNILLYAGGFFCLLLVFGVNRWQSLLGSFLFTFVTYFIIIIAAGHMYKVWAIAFAPWLLVGFFLITRKRYLLGLAVTSFSFFMMIQSNHYQMVYYYFFYVGILVCFLLVDAIRKKVLKSFLIVLVIFGVGLLLGLGASVNKVYSHKIFAEETVRGTRILPSEGSGTELPSDGKKNLNKEWLTSWSLGIEETLTFFIPNAKGGHSNYVGNEKALLEKVPVDWRKFVAQNNTYWGNQPFTEGAHYLGVITLLLFIWGLVFLKGPLKWASIATLILTIMLAWGKNFPALSDFFLYYVPLYDKFRAPASILVVPSLIIPLIGMLGLKKIFEEPKLLDKPLTILKLPAIYLPLIILGGISLFLFLFPTCLTFISDNEMFQFSQLAQQNPKVWLGVDVLEDLRIAIFRADAFRTLIFTALGVGVLFFFRRGSLNMYLTLGVLAVLALFDLWTVNKRFVNDENFIPKQAISQVVQQATEADFSIMKNELRENPALKGKMNEYLQRREKAKPFAHQNEKIEAQFAALNFHTDYRVLNTTTNVFNSNGTSLYHKSIGGYSGAKLMRYQDMIERHIGNYNMEVLNMLNTKYFIVNGEDKKPRMQLNPNANGSVWLVDSVAWVEDALQEINLLSTVRSAEVAVVHKEFFQELDGLRLQKGGARVELVDQKPNQMTYHFQGEHEALAVFSAIWVKEGWQATIDGKPVGHIRCNYILRALRVPAGEHTIVFTYKPNFYYRTATLSSVFLYLMLALLLGALIKEVLVEIKK